MARLCLSPTAAFIAVLAISMFNRPTLALTASKAIDAANAYPNVGVIMVWRDANNPMGLPGGLATYVTGVLIHPQAILTAGHFTARIEGVAASGQLPSWLRIVASFAPNAFDQSTWIGLNRALGTCVAHPSFPRPCTLRAARSMTSTVNPSLESAMWVCAFSISPYSTSALPSWHSGASIERTCPERA